VVSLRVKENGSSNSVVAILKLILDKSMKVYGMVCSRNWIVEMEKVLEYSNPSVEMVHWKKTSIYRMPEWIKDLTKRKA
jgi:hypothetical protein